MLVITGTKERLIALQSLSSICGHLKFIFGTEHLNIVPVAMQIMSGQAAFLISVRSG